MLQRADRRDVRSYRAELCVTAMAKLANEQTSSPSKACKAESKKRVDGQKGHAVQQVRRRRRQAAERSGLALST